MSAKKELASKDTAVILSEFQDYAYRVSHDLGAPVRVMVEFSKLLEQDYADKLDAEAKEYLSIIVESGRKMQAMMEGLLQYSRLNTMREDFTPVDLGLVVQHLQLVMEEPIKKSGAKLIIQDLPTVSADREQMIILFKALIENAIEFQPVGHIPLITISAEKKDKFWQFAISDNGIGIKQQFQDKIFRLFGRLHPDNEYSGVGIGLTLAQKIVQRHGGKIWFESMMGQGCVFYFTLPV